MTITHNRVIIQIHSEYNNPIVWISINGHPFAGESINRSKRSVQHDHQLEEVV